METATPSSRRDQPVLPAAVDLPSPAPWSHHLIVQPPTLGSVCQLTSEQEQRVHDCLSIIESTLGLDFNTNALTNQVMLVEGDGATNGGIMDLCDDEGEARGVYIVDSGNMEVLHSDGKTVINELGPGDFCGEISVLFRTSHHINARSQEK